MACFVIMGVCSSGNLSAALVSPVISASAVDRGGGGGGGGGKRDTEAVGEASFCLSLCILSPGRDVVEGRVVVSNVVPVPHDRAASVVTCNAGTPVAVLDREGGMVGSGPRVWTGRDDAPDFIGEGGSSSSSDSESSLEDDPPPTVEGLLNGESGLSGPSSSSFCLSGRGIVVTAPS